MPMRGTTIVAALFAAGAIMATARSPKRQRPTRRPCRKRRNGRPSGRRSADLRSPSRRHPKQRAARSPVSTRSRATASRRMTATTPSTASWCSNTRPARRRRPAQRLAFAEMVAAYAKDSELRSARTARRPSPIATATRPSSTTAKGKLNHLIDIVPDGDRLYMLISAGPKGHATGEDAGQFRSSFRATDADRRPREAPQAPRPDPRDQDLRRGARIQSSAANWQKVSLARSGLAPGKPDLALRLRRREAQQPDVGATIHLASDRHLRQQRNAISIGHHLHDGGEARGAEAVRASPASPDGRRRAPGRADSAPPPAAATVPRRASSASHACAFCCLASPWTRE